MPRYKDREEDGERYQEGDREREETDRDSKDVREEETNS
jgi:hypothetical protein